ncbi:MAG: MBL fold metallo-hydrolase [Ruminococcaceae bacterium]|nr:MBL fold metallo-hydrolase [Oscillospiraceae bacterium]
MTKRLRAAAALLSALLLSACAAPAAEPGGEGTGAAALEIRFFDAGAADAILLTTADSAVLIDAGEKGFGKTILAYLADKGVEKLDVLIVTHFDKDHVGGAAKVINGIPVDTVLQSNCPKDSEEYEKYVKALETAQIEAQTVREALAFTIGGVRYEIDPPRRESYAEDASNNSSLIVTVRNGSQRFLFAGDAQTERLREYLAASPQHCEVLKAPHHGRAEPALGELLQAVTPAYAVVTSSAEEPEDAAVIAQLERSGAKVFRTRDGAVTAVSDGATLEVTQEPTQ